MSSIPAAERPIDVIRKMHPREQARAIEMLFKALADKIAALEEENARLRLSALAADEVADQYEKAHEPLHEENAKLRAERDEALEALKPFAARIVDVGVDEDDGDQFSNALTPYSQSVSVKVGNVRRAASLIKGGADV